MLTGACDVLFVKVLFWCVLAVTLWCLWLYLIYRVVLWWFTRK
jgi:hypothetical protein